MVDCMSFSDAILPASAHAGVGFNQSTVSMEDTMNDIAAQGA